MRKPATRRILNSKSGHEIPRLRNQVAALSSELRKAHARIAELSSELALRSDETTASPATLPTPASLDPLLSQLSMRERKVVLLFARTGCDKVVAHTLGRAVQTVRNQIASALNKLGLNSRDQLLVLLLSGGPGNGASTNSKPSDR